MYNEMYYLSAHKMAPKQPNTGLFVGLNKGHVVTKKELAPRPSDRKGVSNSSCDFYIKYREILLSANQQSYLCFFSVLLALENKQESALC